MMEITNERPVPDWSTIRVAYESRQALPKDICQQHGITESQLRYRRESEGWVSCRTHTVRRSDLIERMLKVLDKQLRSLEKPVDGPLDKQAMLLSTMAKTFEKLTELQKAQQASQPAQKKDIRDLRDKVARRIEELKRG